MFRSFRIGKLAGIDVFVHWTFLLLLGFFLITGLMSGQGLVESLASVGFVVTLFGCVVLHELGHALAARRYGIPTRDITLLPIGGVARLERIPEKPEQELVVALAGPAVNVVIAGVLAALLLPLGGFDGLIQGETFFHNLLRVNLLLIAFNLLPAFPMDGGRVLRSLLALRMDYIRATDIAAGVGQGMAILFGLGGLLLLGNPMLILVGVFVYFGAAAEARQARMRRQMTNGSPYGAGHYGSPDPYGNGSGGFGGQPSRVVDSRPVYGQAVGDVMVRQFRVLPAYLRVGEIAAEYLAGSQRDFPIVDQNQVVGVLTRDDLNRALQRGGGDRIADVMKREFAVAQVSDPIRSSIAKLAGSGVGTMLVMQGNHLVGIVQMSDSDAAVSDPVAYTGGGYSSQEPMQLG